MKVAQYRFKKKRKFTIKMPIVGQFLLVDKQKVAYRTYIKHIFWL